MNKKISVGIAVSFILIAVTITFTAAMIFSMNLFDSKVSSAQERASMYEKLSEIDKAVRQNYYKEIDDAYLSDSLARGYIDGVADPDSSYLSVEEVAARDREATGTKITVGIEVEKDTTGYLLVNKVYSESSAQKIGMAVGDVITEVDGQNVLKAGYETAVTLLDGADGSKLKLTYQQDGIENIVELTRAAVDVPSVSYAQIDDIFYIRISLFCNTTVAQFDYAVNAARSATSAAGVVIDIRDVKGGYDLTVAANLLDMLLPTGKLITGVFANGEEKVLYTSDEVSLNMPIAVLVNENTEGYSELFAAVLGDADNCRIVGKSTAGKGTYQKLVKLADGSGVDITIAEFETPLGNTFNDVGVAPDFAVDSLEGFVRKDSPDETSDAQYKKAAEVLRSLM